MLDPKKETSNIAVILLAAGESSRLGSPKQLLIYRGETLLQHSLQAASQSAAQPVIVVLGANAHLIKNTIASDQAYVMVNDAWQEGMASSIRYGITTMMELYPGTEAAILMVCDQPYISATVINTLVAAYHQTGKKIITSSYAGTLGSPSLFHKSIFSELLQLQGDLGAKSILRQHPHAIEVVSFSEGNIDIDTESDYQKLF